MAVATTFRSLYCVVVVSEDVAGHAGGGGAGGGGGGGGRGPARLHIRGFFGTQFFFFFSSFLARNFLPKANRILKNFWFSSAIFT